VSSDKTEIYTKEQSEWTRIAVTVYTFHSWLLQISESEYMFVPGLSRTFSGHISFLDISTAGSEWSGSFSGCFTQGKDTTVLSQLQLSILAGVACGLSQCQIQIP
jgi:hypothetical protein